jgi:hypothetical protein
MFSLISSLFELISFINVDKFSCFDSVINSSAFPIEVLSFSTKSFSVICVFVNSVICWKNFLVHYLIDPVYCPHPPIVG